MCLVRQESPGLLPHPLTHSSLGKVVTSEAERTRVLHPLLGPLFGNYLPTDSTGSSLSLEGSFVSQALPCGKQPTVVDGPGEQKPD